MSSNKVAYVFFAFHGHFPSLCNERSFSNSKGQTIVQRINAYNCIKSCHTCHSSNPCMLSEFNFLMATTIPVPTLVGVNVFSSTHPLNTVPKPPTPKTVSDLKFLVAAFRSLKLYVFKFGVGNISPFQHKSSLPVTDKRLRPVLLLVENPTPLL